jgi:hypothetical protein
MRLDRALATGFLRKAADKVGTKSVFRCTTKRHQKPQVSSVRGALAMLISELLCLLFLYDCQLRCSKTCSKSLSE